MSLWILQCIFVPFSDVCMKWCSPLLVIIMMRTYAEVHTVLFIIKLLLIMIYRNVPDALESLSSEKMVRPEQERCQFV